MKIGFIGLGNMAKAMIGGMLQKGMVEAGDIAGSAKTKGTLERMREEFGILVMESKKNVAKWADGNVLAVKPVFLSEVIGEIREEATEEKLVISIAAGKSLQWLEGEFGTQRKLIRCMPNTPALAGAGCTAVCSNPMVERKEEELCLKLMESFGKAIVIPERLMDAAGAVAGSSPAFVFLFIEAMADGAVREGMPRKQAYEFAASAVAGSAKLILETGMHPGELKDMVCSPGGTTIEGVAVLEEKGMRSAVMEAIHACVEKSGRL